MSKQDELKELAENYAHCYSFVGDDTMPIARDKLYEAIDAICQKDDKWVSVKSHLPRKKGRYHVWVNAHLEVQWFNGNVFPNPRVTHWQSMPSKPEEKA